MKHLASILRLSGLVLLSGCGGGDGTSGPPPQALNIVGNWQFSKTSTDPVIPPRRLLAVSPNRVAL
jgi:hypothetical protein